MGSSPHERAQAARRFQATAAFQDPFAAGFEPLGEVRALLTGQHLDAAGLVAEAARIFGLDGQDPAASLRAHLDSAQGRATRLRLVESILSLSYVPQGSPDVPDDRVGALKIFELLEIAARGRWPFPGSLTLDGALDRMTAVIPSDLAAVRIDRTDPAANDRRPQPPDTKLDDLKRKIGRYGQALDDLGHPTVIRGLEITAHAPRVIGRASVSPSRGGGFFSRLFGRPGTTSPQPIPGVETAPTALAVRIAPDTFDGIHESHGCLPGARI